MDRSLTRAFIEQIDELGTPENGAAKAHYEALTIAGLQTSAYYIALRRLAEVQLDGFDVLGVGRGHGLLEGWFIPTTEHLRALEVTQKAAKTWPGRLDIAPVWLLSVASDPAFAPRAVIAVRGWRHAKPPLFIWLR